MKQIARLIQDLPTNNNVTTIGVCGGSGSGKTFIAHKLSSELASAGYEVITINQDDFSIGRGFANKHTSPYKWDDPENYRLDECSQAIKQLKKGKQFSFKAYNLIDHEPSELKTYGFNSGAPKKIIIIEGILAWYGPLKPMVDFRIFIELDFYERFVLRLFRNLYQIKNVTADTVIQQYFTHVALAHTEIIDKLKSEADQVWQQSINLLEATRAETINHEPKINLRTLHEGDSLKVSVGQPDMPWLAIHINDKLVFSQKILKENQQLMADSVHSELR